MTKISTRLGTSVSPAVTVWEDIDTTDALTFKRDVSNVLLPFYINNLSDEAISRTGRGPEMAENQTVKLLPGWNEYILVSIVLESGDLVQWGE